MDTAVDRLRAAVTGLLVDDSIAVPVLPQVATQVLQIAGGADADSDQLSELIHQDQALAGRLLMIANSSIYGGRIQIVSLQQAIARLGLSALCEITFLTCVKARVFHVPGHEDMIKKMWRNSMATGSFAKEIARHLRNNVENAFLSGLLHNVGQPVLLQVLIDQCHRLQLKAPKSQIEALIEEFQQPVAEKIAQEWSLPEAVATAMVHYQHYEELTSFENEAMITHLASQLGAWATSNDPVDESEIHAIPTFAELNFYPEDVEAILSKREAILSLLETTT